MDPETAHTYYNIIALALVFLIISWILMPLSLMRLNSLVGRLLREHRKTNELLRDLRSRHPGNGALRQD